jgi:hypothetical protein
MTSLRARAALGLTSVLILSVAYGIFDFALINSFRKAAYFSGFTLLGSMLALTLFNGRKKLPFLPLLTASAWLQFHIYAGLFSTVVFLFHIGFRIPRGGLEVILASLFAGVTLSGLLGLMISRWVPPRLTLHGENLIFERIPALRENVRQAVEKIALESVPTTNSTTIIDFYQRKLRAYFDGPRYLSFHLAGYSKPLYGMLDEVAAMDRYLNSEERKVMAQLVDFIRTKDNLDFQLAAQGLLKGWLFVHIPLTYGLLLLAVVHAVLAWKF